jgi:hypothetical protein
VEILGPLRRPGVRQRPREYERRAPAHATMTYVTGDRERPVYSWLLSSEGRAAPASNAARTNTGMANGRLNMDRQAGAIFHGLNGFVMLSRAGGRDGVLVCIRVVGIPILQASLRRCAPIESVGHYPRIGIHRPHEFVHRCVGGKWSPS